MGGACGDAAPGPHVVGARGMPPEAAPRLPNTGGIAKPRATSCIPVPLVHQEIELSLHEVPGSLRDLPDARRPSFSSEPDLRPKVAQTWCLLSPGAPVGADRGCCLSLNQAGRWETQRQMALSCPPMSPDSAQRALFMNPHELSFFGIFVFAVMWK